MLRSFTGRGTMLLIPLHLENWSSVFCLYARQLIMRSSWPFFYKHSILVVKLINKSWLLDMFVRKNQSQKKNKRNLKSFQVDCDNCDHGFFWPWSVPSQGRSWGESLEWLTSKKGLGYGLEGLTTFCFFFWFCLILFDFVCPSCKHSGPCRFRVPFNADFCT